jgi:hypothetical protein
MIFDGRIPPQVKQHHARAARQIEPDGTSLKAARITDVSETADQDTSTEGSYLEGDQDDSNFGIRPDLLERSFLLCSIQLAVDCSEVGSFSFRLLLASESHETAYIEQT